MTIPIEAQRDAAGAEPPLQIPCFDPATRERLGEVRVDNAADVDAAVARAKIAQKQWRRTSFEERRHVLRLLMAHTVDHKDEICADIQRDSGKTRENALMGEIWTTCEKFRWMINIAVVFTVSGIWHGANWTFLIWGGFFGLIYITEKIINTRFNLEKTYSAYSIGHILLALKTFVMVTILWIFFRSQSFDDAMNIFKYLYLNTGTSSVLSVPVHVWVFLMLFIISDIILYNKRFDSWVNKFVLVGRWGVYAFLIFSIIVFAGVENFPFIYFQF